ncbi:MAG: UDP-N-acetylmuramoyl-L-alanyl-D-glutamate--2,6-diaminopimelate ligase [Lachnospiraceae bacterium]|nr:UDP-N-acetylmuramoyl-L-alanyl-D-glutamate--2,6-diaminopimelate ligase [Lachnospiraceae bacterium]
METKTLRALLENLSYTLIQGDLDLPITGVCMDSRKVEEGNLFICISGYQTDGHTYIPMALEKGAKALVVEKDVEVPADIAVIRVEDARIALALLSAAWYGHPSKEMCVIGLTGTKGKTTTAHMIKKILEEAGNKVGMIGTNGAFIGGEKVGVEIKNTTPESFDLQHILRIMKDEGCTHVVMEVSSQGLKLNRVLGIDFDYGAFLNLSPDHISENEHKTFEEYKECKMMLFSMVKKSVIFLDNEHSADFLKVAPNPTTVSLKGEADYSVSDIHNLWDGSMFGVEFLLHRPDQTSEAIRVAMPGYFNAENAAIACALTSLEGVDAATQDAALKNVSVKGRTQIIPEALPIACMVIDYAHNAFSSECVLQMLREYNPKRLIALFGCGGNRAVARRIGMGEVAGRMADLSVITMDNPRNEPMSEINKGIIEGINQHNGKYICIDDRKEAIAYVLENAEPGDIIALLGKGHETYQEIEGKRYPFSEEETILEWLKEHNIGQVDEK